MVFEYTMVFIRYFILVIVLLPKQTLQYESFKFISEKIVKSFVPKFFLHDSECSSFDLMTMNIVDLVIP